MVAKHKLLNFTGYSLQLPWQSVNVKSLFVYFTLHTLWQYTPGSISAQQESWNRVRDTQNRVANFGLNIHGVPRAPVREISSRVYLSVHCLNPQNTMHFTRLSRLSLYIALRRWRNEVKYIVFFYTDLNNRRTGKDATKPRTLGLFGHSKIELIWKF